MQAQIRQNAEEVSSYLTEMSKWEKTINKKVAKRTIISEPKAAPVRPGSGTVKYPIPSSEFPRSRSAGSVKLATTLATGITVIPTEGFVDECISTTHLTPASLAEMHLSTKSSVGKTVVPVARGVASLKDAETAERDRGNSEYESGNFTAAIKSYTKCLGLKVRDGNAEQLKIIRQTFCS